MKFLAIGTLAAFAALAAYTLREMTPEERRKIRSDITTDTATALAGIAFGVILCVK